MQNRNRGDNVYNCGMRGLSWLMLLLLPLCLRAESGGKISMPTYQTRYYTIYTDLPEERVREAELRMSRMVEVYRQRTADFAGAVSQRLPFYLFTRERDYLDAGGIEGSSGVFDRASQVLMAVAGEKPSVETWYVVQHEGFHQFAHAVIGGELPIWVNEGLAEYFGEAIFTGDTFITGAIPDWRLRRIKAEITADKFRSIEEMMKLEHAKWNDEISVVNYDQAWSMVHFLAHGEGGKYQRAFVNYMRDLGARVPGKKAWEENFGSAEGFEAKWKSYWQKLEEGSTAEVYAKATLQTLTGALGRAYVKKQFVNSVEELEKLITGGKLKLDAQDWLPASVFDVALENLKQLRKQGCRFSVLVAAGRQPVVVCQMSNGGKMTARFTVVGNRVGQVTVSAPAAPPLASPKRGSTRMSR
jgi:hypothetical protein